MTWGTTNTNEKAPVQVFSPESGIVAVQGEYPHLPRKSVLAVSSMTLISGVLCILIGIAQEVISRDWRYVGICCGILFAITGILGVVSVYKRTKGRLIATAVLAIICCLSACSLGMSAAGEFCKGRSHDRYKRSGRHHESGETDRHWREYESGERGGHYKAYKVVFGMDIVFFVISLLVFCCGIALAVFTLKTVTSPKGKDQKRGPVMTPVVSFPPSKDPNQLDTYNGN